MTTATRKAILPLRDYQQEALRLVLEAWAAGKRRVLVSHPTGAGKTFTFSHLINRARDQGVQRAVVIVHRDELVRQTIAHVEQISPGLGLGVVKANQNDLHAQTIVASAQTLARESRLEALAVALDGQRLLLISDEAHHDRAPMRQRAIERLDADLTGGFTATAGRGDGLALGDVYEDIVHHVSMLGLIGRGHLCHLIGIRVETETVLDDVHTRCGEFVENELADAVDTEPRNAQIVRSWKDHAEGRRRTVVFAVNVAHAKNIAQAFADASIGAACIFGETPSDERAALLQEFHLHPKELPVLVNCMVLTEGYDEPGIDCILMARPIKSPWLYIQMVGRGARRSEGKQDCLVLDFVDNTSRHKLVTLPTLAGVDDTEGTAPAEDERDDGEQIDLFGFAAERRAVIEKRAVEVDLFGESPYLWRVAGGLYMTPAGEGRWLVLDPEKNGLFTPMEVRKGKYRYDPAIWEPLIDRGLDFEIAMGVAEQLIVQDQLTTKTASWRTRKEAATAAQIKFARSLGIRHPEELTKGECSDAIDNALFERIARRR